MFPCNASSRFRATSTLSASEISRILHLIAGRQPYGIYFNAALEDLGRGIDNRTYCIDGGLTMRIDFDEISIFTVVDDVEESVMREIAASPGRMELHIPEHYRPRFRTLLGSRLEGERKLRYYQLSRGEEFSRPAADIRRMGAEDLGLLREFYAAHYGDTIFSSWMLERPFFGLFVGSELAAAGGAIVVDNSGKAANIGNFLTAPKFRGRHFARELAKCLLTDLMRAGIHTFTLGTTEENVAAWKAYEAIGFQLLDTRAELIVGAKAAVRELAGGEN